MPFTLAHAAAALPLRRMRLVWSAFVIGTFAPDFETFLTFSSEHRYGHRFPGLLLFTFPTGLLALWLFHRYLKTPLVELAPEGLRLRLLPYVKEFRFAGARRWLAIVGSMAAGIATHLLWDSFTHIGWLSSNVAWFGEREVVPWVDGLHFPTHLTILQLSSSVLGCLALLIWFVLWYRAAEPARACHRPIFSSALRAAITATMLVLPWALAGLLAIDHGHEPQDFVHTTTFAKYLVILPGSVLTLELLVYSLFANRLRSSRRML